jgi:peptidoglycan/LPS O-acetylase OafA/YrhL
MFVLSGRRSGTGIVLGTLFVGIVWSATPILGQFKIGPLESFEFFRLGSFFLSGAALAVIWPYIGRHALTIGVAGLIGIFLVRNLVPIDTIFHPLTVAAATIGLGSSRAMAWFSKGGDASYGMYVFAWPVQQFSLLLIEPFWLSMLAAFAATSMLGYATWHTFEKRALSYSDRFARIFQSGNRPGQLAKDPAV